MKLIKRNDKIFIAGHNGMVGSGIVRALKQFGYKNILIVNRKEVDLTDINAVSNWFLENKPTVVISAAARVGGIYANNNYPYDFIMENMKIQNNLIESSWKNNVRRFLFLGSSCMYPKLAEQPIKESSLLSGYVEKTNEAYAIAKISGLKLCQALRKQHNFDAISLIPTNIYGPGDNFHPENSHVIPALIRKFSEAKKENSESVTCWGSGNIKREFLHVDDLGEACVFVLEEWDPDSESAPKDDKGIALDYLNVGYGSDITIKELADIISSRCNYKGNIYWDIRKPDGSPKKQLSIQKLSELGWHSKRKLELGIQSSIDFFQGNIV